MPEPRFPTLDEFFKRLEVRALEPDLRDALRARMDRERRPIARVGREATVVAVVARLLPGNVPAKALAAFLDQNFDKQLGRGDEKQGLMPRGELIPEGFRVLDEEARKRHGRRFAEVGPELQDELLAAAEKGELEGPEGFDAATWFMRTRAFLLLGFGSDPRGMVQMGFPGPSYQTGHVWLDQGEVQARAARKRGYLRL